MQENSVNLENMMNEVIEILGLDVERFKEMDDNEVVFATHHDLGTFLRNKWFWNPSEYQTWFNDIGLYHADDMSSVLLRCTHCYLNNKDFDVDNISAEYIKYWKSIGIDPTTGKNL